MKEQLEKILNIDIKDVKHFELAFTHRSAVNESRNLNQHNERMEFLGDAVLELIVTEYLYHKLPDLPEGELTNLRASLVKGETLAQVAEKLDFGSILRMSRGEDKFGGRQKSSILANTVEACIGALYLDQGYEAAQIFVYDNLIPLLDEIRANNDHIDAKSEFQHKAQSLYKITPYYKELDSFGPDHEKTFTVGVFIGDKKFGEGQGSSKQAAQQEAAKDALSKI